MFDSPVNREVRLPNMCLKMLVPVENIEDGDNYGDWDWIMLEL